MARITPPGESGHKVGIGKQNAEKTNIQKQEREGSPSPRCKKCHLNETKESPLKERDLSLIPSESTRGKRLL